MKFLNQNNQKKWQILDDNRCVMRKEFLYFTTHSELKIKNKKMKAKAIRLYGPSILKMDDLDLWEIQDDEILASVVTDSICMSTYKLAIQGENHKKAPKNLADHPIIVGHEFCGEILQVGKKWQTQFKAGEKYVVQANLNLPNSPHTLGHSYQFTGGDATMVIMHPNVMEQGCLIPYRGESFFEGSLTEPLSCIIGAFKAQYHLVKGTYQHQMGIKEDGNLLIMGGTGPMGLIGIDYAMHGPRNPKNIVVTDIDSDKLKRAEKLYSSDNNVNLFFVNTQNMKNVSKELEEIVKGKFDDIFVMAPVQAVVEDAAKLLAFDGCLNLFAGPSNQNFSATLNCYDIHYNYTHYVGTSGGHIEDVKDGVKLIEEKKVNLAKVVTHILGLNAVIETTLNQPKIGGGKKLVYTNKKIDLLTLEEILQNKNSELAKIIEDANGLWSKKAEDYILKHFENIID